MSTLVEQSSFESFLVLNRHWIVPTYLVEYFQILLSPHSKQPRFAHPLKIGSFQPVASSPVVLDGTFGFVPLPQVRFLFERKSYRSKKHLLLQLATGSLGSTQSSPRSRHKR